MAPLEVYLTDDVGSVIGDVSHDGLKTVTLLVFVKGQTVPDLIVPGQFR